MLDGPLLIVEGNPVVNDPQSVGLALKPVTMHALLLKCPYRLFHHSVLAWAVWRDEFLPKAVSAHQGLVVTAGEG